MLDFQEVNPTLRPRDTVHPTRRDAGSAENAGAVFCLYIPSMSIHGHQVYLHPVGIVAPCHPDTATYITSL